MTDNEVINKELNKLNTSIESLFPNTFNVEQYDELISHKDQLQLLISELRDDNRELVEHDVCIRVRTIINQLRK